MVMLEVASLMEGQRQLTKLQSYMLQRRLFNAGGMVRGGQFNGMDEQKHGQFNGGRMVMLRRWPV